MTLDSSYSHQPLMDFTLWRNGVQLGRLRLSLSFEDHPEPGDLSAMLEVDPAFTDVDELWQLRFDVGGPVLHFPLPEGEAAPTPGGRASREPMRVPGRRLSAEEAAGVPPDRRLELRNAHGEIVAADWIMINRIPAEVTTRPRWTKMCAAAGIDISPWAIWVRLGTL